MPHRPRPSPWLRVCGVALTSLALTFSLILLLQSERVQAGPNVPGDPQAGVPFDRPRSAPGTPALDITVEAPSTTVVPGDLVTYTIELRHVGGTSPLRGRLLNPFRSATLPHVDGMRVLSVGTVTPDSVQVSYGASQDEPAGLRWQGSMAPDSLLQIRYAATVEACYDPNPVTVRNTVAIQGENGATLTDRADIQVNCLPAVDPANIAASTTWGWREGAAGDLVPGTSGAFQIELTNNDPNPTVLGLVGVFPRRNTKISMPTLQRVTSLGWKVEEGESLAGAAAETVTHLFVLPLAAGETRVLRLPARLLEDVPPESVLEAQVGYCITYDGRSCPGADPQSTTPPPSLKWLPPASFTVRYRDLGDTPDSTTHDTATSMSAYAGVQANFPTVFDPNTGPDQGPAHLNPRPFHLGRRVSPEAEADRGPDLDPTHNIIPSTNTANRDRRDDGIAVKQLDLRPCQAGRVPVRVLIRPAAVAFFQRTGGKGYLNLWLDGNHDGDWADSRACPAGKTAVEHIVVDHPVDVAALGAGLHTLSLPTGLVPWSGQAAWLRVTLSERPSNKTLNAGGIRYGDGRGYSVPFALGETEDYLLRPPGTEGAGPDVAVDVAAGWRALAPDSAAQLDLVRPSLEIHLTASYFMAEYRNEGSETARDVVLTHYIPRALEGLAPRIVGVPPLGDGVIAKAPGGIQISLGDLDPGEGGSVVLGWYCLTCTTSLSVSPATALTGTTTIQSSGDTNPANNQADSSVEIPQVIQVGFSSPGGLYQRTSGTTCRNTVELRGRTTPNTTLNIFSDGFESGDLVAQVTSGADGYFKQLINLANGRHRIGLVPQDVQSAAKPRPASLLKSPLGPAGITANMDIWLIIQVNNHLPWNPSSLTLTDSQGRTIQPYVTGFENQAGWYGYLKAGETYQLGLEYCGSDPNPLVELSFLGRTIPMADPDGDGVYIAEISKLPAAAAFSTSDPSGGARVSASAPITVSITAGPVETVFGGTVQAGSEGIVYDARSGQALRASVTLLEAIDDAAEIGFDLWPGAGYGQANPQTSSAQGEYAFWPEPGTYHLAVSRAGYQTYRSWDVHTTGEPVNLDLPLTPRSAAADYIVEIGRDGFEPSWLVVPPGAVVRWINTGVGDHTSTGISPTLAGPGVPGSGGWDSGRLSSGDSYLWHFARPGTYAYADRANPSNTAHIRVSGSALYLPLIVK